MAYYDAISNAIAARGNALAQAAQQQGQVYGNLASNLGQLPFQAMQAGQRRRALEVETQQRAAQTQTIQNELDFQKEAYATMNKPGLTPEQRDLEMGNVLKKFGKWEQAEAIRMRQEAGDRAKFDLLKGTPGNQLPPGGQLALPEPGRSSSVFGPGTFQPQGPVTQPGGMQNAFAPPTPIESQLVHREIPGLGAPPTEMQEHQQKVAKIKSLGLDPETEKLAIEALVVPPGILAAQARGSFSPQVGLGVGEYVSSDGANRISGQSTRSGHVLITAGNVVDPASGRTYQPGELAPPNVMASWTKVYHQPLQVFPNQQGSIDVLNKEELARRMARGGQISGVVPDIRPAETKTPLVNLRTGVVEGEWGSRSGRAGMTGTGAPMPTEPTDETAPPAPPIELGKSPRTTVENNLRTYMQNSATQLQKIAEISKRRPDLIGQWDYLKAWGTRKLGLQKDPDANSLINALNRFTEDTIRAKEGAVIPDAMYARLEGIVSGKGWSNEEQFAQDLGNAMSVLQTGFAERRIPWPGQGAAPAAPSAPAGGGGGRIVQRNKRTGAVRHSDDQGKTWQPGP